MKFQKALLFRMAILVAGDALLVAGIWAGIRSQFSSANRAINRISDLKDPSPFRVALLGHLGKIHLGVQAELRSHDPALAKQISESRDEFDASLPEFEKQNPRLFPLKASEEIRQMFEAYKAGVDRTLALQVLRLERRASLEQNFARMLDLIEHQLRPLIRRSQPDGEERATAVLNIENQLRAWQQSLAQAWAQPTPEAKNLAMEADNRGESHLERYADLQLLPREIRIQREIRNLWRKNSDLARESFVWENQASSAEQTLSQQREQVVATLNQFLPALPPDQLELRKQAILRTMRLHMGMAFGLAILALVSIVLGVLALYRMTHRPMPLMNGIFHVPAVKGESEPSALGDETLQMDLQGTITVWSDLAQSLYGFSAAEMRGRSIAQLFESESEIVRLSHELQSARQAAFEMIHKTKSGAAVRVRIEFNPVHDPSGKTIGISLICLRRT